MEELEDDEDDEQDPDDSTAEDSDSQSTSPIDSDLSQSPTLSTSSPYYPKPFSPPSPSDTPHNLFHETRAPRAEFSPSATGHRFTRISNPKEMLISVDGSCLDNGQAGPRAGCAFVYSPGSLQNGTCAFRLESKGPTGTVHKQTSNRAELHAVIAALQYRFWFGEGYSRIVIATDSEYIVKGMTQWVQGWVRNGWVTNQKTAVKNRDLWELLLEEVQRYMHISQTANWLPGSANRAEYEILFWHIPRGLNTQADGLAKEAATLEDVEEHTKRCGMFG